MEKSRMSTATQVTLALRLGWSLAEFMGRSRRAWRRQKKRHTAIVARQPPKELRGFDADEAPRFTYSNRYFSHEGAWWQSAVRLVSLADQLGVLEGENELDARVRALPDCVHALTYEGEVPGEFDSCSPREFFDLLEPWGRRVGTQLAAQDDLAALAFKVGGQLADTYWYMRGSDRYGEPRHSDKQDSWHQLLNHKRLTTIIEDIKRFDRYLPPLVGECLRFSLFRWMIAHDLEYRRQRLILVRDKDSKDPSLEREKEGILKRLQPRDEQRILARLRRQSDIWQDLVLGRRTPADFLGKDEEKVTLLIALLIYLGAMVAASVILTAIGYILIVVLGGTVSAAFSWLWERLLPANTTSDTLKTSVEIVTKTLPLVIGAVVFVGSLVRDVWTRSRGLWQQIYDVMLEREIKDQCWIPWRDPKEF